MWFPCRKSDLGFCFQKSQTTGSPFFGRSNIDGPRLGWSRCIRCPGDSWHFRGHLPVSSAAFSLSGGLSGDEKIRENDQKILGGGLQILNENPWKSHGICPNSILELQKSRPQKLGTQLAWKATVVGFTNHVPETNPAMAQISGMVQFLIFLHLISLFPLFPLNLLPLPCLQYSFPSLSLLSLFLFLRLPALRWSPLWGAILESVTPHDPASGRRTCCTHPTDSIHSILSAGQTIAKCLQKCQWDGTWHKDP